MDIKFSDELNEVFRYACDEAMRTGSVVICADHLMLGILRHRDNDACRALERLGAAPDELKRTLDGSLLRKEAVPYSSTDSISVARSAQNAINLSALEALKESRTEVSAMHMLLALCQMRGTLTASILEEKHVDTASLRSGAESPERPVPRKEVKTIPLVIVKNGKSLPS